MKLARLEWNGPNPNRNNTELIYNVCIPTLRYIFIRFVAQFPKLFTRTEKSMKINGLILCYNNDREKILYSLYLSGSAYTHTHKKGMSSEKNVGIETVFIHFSKKKAGLVLYPFHLITKLKKPLVLVRGRQQQHQQRDRKKKNTKHNYIGRFMGFASRKN